MADNPMVCIRCRRVKGHCYCPGERMFKRVQDFGVAPVTAALAQEAAARIHPETLVQTTCPLEMLASDEDASMALGIDAKAPEGGKPGDAMRANTGKAPLELLPPLALLELARHYGAGARKYARHNWLQGGQYSVCEGAMQRHLMRWRMGENIDPETGTHHMAAVAWNALTLLEYAMRGIGDDDRMPAAPGGSWPPEWAVDVARTDEGQVDEGQADG